MYDRVIVALDGSSLAEQVLPHVEALAEKFGSTVTLVRAILPLEQVAALVEPSIIALTTHGRGGLGRLIFGSVADRVLRGASCPVLLVRATEAR